jgi:hypothetical protein
VPGIGGEPLSPALVVSGRARCSSVPFRGADPLLSSKPLCSFYTVFILPDALDV